MSGHSKSNKHSRQIAPFFKLIKTKAIVSTYRLPLSLMIAIVDARNSRLKREFSHSCQMNQRFFL